MEQQNNISLALKKVGLTSDRHNSSTDQHSAMKSKLLNSIDKIRKNKKRDDLNGINDYVLKTEVSNLEQDFIETMISELTDQYLIENRRTPQDLDPIGASCQSHHNKGKSFVK